MIAHMTSSEWLNIALGSVVGIVFGRVFGAWLARRMYPDE